MKKTLMLVALALLAGCATLNPNADPLVVRAEQAQTLAGPSFDLVLNTDHSNRSFWRTNAPAFHQFCEWLRTPMEYGPSNTVSRAVLIQLNLDDVKLAYKRTKNTGTSNALVLALSVLQTATAQAQSWQTIVTTP